MSKDDNPKIEDLLKFRIVPLDEADGGDPPDVETALTILGLRKSGIPANDIPGLHYLGGAWLEDLESAASSSTRAAFFFFGYVYCCTYDMPHRPEDHTHTKLNPFTYRLSGNRIYTKSILDTSEVEDPNPATWSSADGKLTINWPNRPPMTLSPTSYDELRTAGYNRLGLIGIYAGINTAINGTFEERVDHLPLVVPGR